MGRNRAGYLRRCVVARRRQWPPSGTACHLSSADLAQLNRASSVSRTLSASVCRIVRGASAKAMTSAVSAVFSLW